MQNRNNHRIKQRHKSNKTKGVLKIFMYDLPPEFQISSMKVAYSHSSTPTTTERSHHRSLESCCFLSAVTRPKPNSNPSSPNVLLSISLKVLDKDATGFVSVNELRHILTSIGEKLELSLLSLMNVLGKLMLGLMGRSVMKIHLKNGCQVMNAIV
jgi:hypothetical protein